MRFKCTLFRLQNNLRSPLDSARITGAASAHITEGVICTAHHHFVAATRFLRARRFCSSTTTSLLATYEVSVLRNHGIEVEPAADFSSARSLQRLHHYDWIFLDVRRHFPGDAPQFYEQIKDASPGQRFAFLVGPPLYLSLTWPDEISLEEASRGQWEQTVKRPARAA